MLCNVVYMCICVHVRTYIHMWTCKPADIQLKLGASSHAAEANSGARRCAGRCSPGATWGQRNSVRRWAALFGVHRSPSSIDSGSGSGTGTGTGGGSGGSGGGSGGGSSSGSGSGKN